MQPAFVHARARHRVIGQEHPHEAGALRCRGVGYQRIRGIEQRLGRSLSHLGDPRRGGRRGAGLLMHVPCVSRVCRHVQALRGSGARLLAASRDLHGLPGAAYGAILVMHHGVHEAHRGAAGRRDAYRKRGFARRAVVRLRAMVRLVSHQRAFGNALRAEIAFGVRRPHALRRPPRIREEAGVHSRPRPVRAALARDGPVHRTGLLHARGRR